MHGWPSILRRKWVSRTRVYSVLKKNVLKCLYLVRIERPDILRSVNKLARAVTKWTKSLWKARDAFDLVHSSHMWILAVLFCVKHSTTMQTRIVSRLGFCRRPLKINIRRNSVLFGSHTFVPICGMCKKQTSVSHSSFVNSTFTRHIFSCFSALMIMSRTWHWLKC